MTTPLPNLVSYAYLGKPPVQMNVVEEDGKLSTTWTNWLNSVTEITGYVIAHDYLLNATGGVESDAPVVQLISYTNEQRNLLQNALTRSLSANTNLTNPSSITCTVIYNIDNEQPEFAINGAWYTFTKVAAP